MKRSEVKWKDMSKLGRGEQTSNGSSNPIADPISSHSHPNLGAPLSYRDQPNLVVPDVSGSSGSSLSSRKNSTISTRSEAPAAASIAQQRGQARPDPKSYLRETSLPTESNPGSSSGSGSRTGSPVDSKKSSKRVLNHWRQAASVSNRLIGHRTKNLLGKWKTTHSQSVDLVGYEQQSSTLAGSGGGTGSDPCVADSTASKLPPAMSLDSSTGVAVAPEAKTKWSEHVWTAWVHRGFSDDVTEVRTLQPGGDLLTEFQKDKFRYFFFHVLDLNSDFVISAEDFEKLNERIRHYMDWNTNCIQYLAMKEVHATFLDCFLKTAANFIVPDDGFDYWDPFKKLDALYDKMEHVTLTDVLNDDVEVEKKTCVTIDEWIDVWGTLVGNKKKLDDFPMWLQYYPKILFNVINRADTGIITKSELKHFYTAFMDVGKLGEERLDTITDNAFNAMTSGGETKLNYYTFKLAFLNFLLGKQPNGPGQYLFGTVEPKNETCAFPIDYSALNAQEEDLEPFRPNKLQDKGSRRSVLV